MSHPTSSSQWSSHLALWVLGLTVGLGAASCVAVTPQGGSAPPTPPAATQPANVQEPPGKGVEAITTAPTNLRTRWTCSLHLERVRNAYLVGDLLFVEVAYGRLLALDANTGALLWSRLQPKPLDQPPCAQENMVYYFAGGRMYAVHKDSGTDEINKKVPIAVVTPPICYKDLLLVASSHPRINGVGMKTAWPEWFKRYEDHILGLVLYSNERLIVLDAAGNLCSHSPKDGSLQWTTRLEKPPIVAPAASAEAVFVGGADYFLYAFDPRGGGIVWKSPTGAASVQPPIYAHGVVVGVLQSGEAAAFEAKEGTLLWKLPGAQRFLTATPKRAYLVMSDNTLLCVGLQDGVPEGRLDIGRNQFLCSEPERGQFFAVTPQGRVTCLADTATLPRREYAPE